MLFSKVVITIYMPSSMRVPVALYATQHLVVLDWLLYFFNSKIYIFPYGNISEIGMYFAVIVDQAMHVRKL